MTSDVDEADLDSFDKHVENLPTVNIKPIIKGTIRQHYSDFEVNETLSFEPRGEGEHLFLYIEKRCCNSQWVADELQRYFKLRSQDVGYAGKKDRHSISRQWFSLHLPGKVNEVSQAEFDDLDNDSFRVLQSIRHNKKLRKGVIKNNHFVIKVSQLSGEINQALLDKISTDGFPNYFGYQRFGHNGNNLVKAKQLFNNEIRVRSRNKKGLYLSAARSYLFNLMLAERINKQSWGRVLAGDCLSLSGSQSYFVCEQAEGDIKQRFNDGDIHISGWLAGSQKSEAIGDALAHELEALENHTLWLKGLDKARLSSARRPMRVIPNGLKMTKLESDHVIIEFSLPSGSFATSLLQELFLVNDSAIKPVSTIEEELGP